MRKKYVFDVDKTVSYWLESAKYDLGVANAMLKARKYPYALFMEKLLKALVSRERRPMRPSPIHSHISWRGRV